VWEPWRPASRLYPFAMIHLPSLCGTLSVGSCVVMGDKVSRSPSIHSSQQLEACIQSRQVTNGTTHPHLASISSLTFPPAPQQVACFLGLSTSHTAQAKMDLPHLQMSSVLLDHDEVRCGSTLTAWRPTRVVQTDLKGNSLSARLTPVEGTLLGPLDEEAM
jgi:hypothetical protein